MEQQYVFEVDIKIRILSSAIIKLYIFIDYVINYIK